MKKFSSPFMAKSPLKQEGGKFGHRDPGTGWSQKEKLNNPQAHKKVVKEGVKTVPAMGLLGAMGAVGGMPAMAGATAVAAGIDIVKRVGEKVANFYSGAKKKLK